MGDYDWLTDELIEYDYLGPDHEWYTRVDKGFEPTEPIVTLNTPDGGVSDRVPTRVLITRYRAWKGRQGAGNPVFADEPLPDAPKPRPPYHEREEAFFADTGRADAMDLSWRAARREVREAKEREWAAYVAEDGHFAEMEATK